MNSGSLKKNVKKKKKKRKSHRKKKKKSLSENETFSPPTWTAGNLSVTKLSCNSWNWGLLIVLLIRGNLLLRAFSFRTARPVKGNLPRLAWRAHGGVARLVPEARSRFTRLIKNRWQTYRRFFTLIVIEQRFSDGVLTDSQEIRRFRMIWRVDNL